MINKPHINHDTIIAPATIQGQSAIAIIRMSGQQAIEIIQKIFFTLNGKSTAITTSHHLVLGTIRNSNHNIIDEVLVSYFKAPHSYTGEDLIEISCHGSTYIVQEILLLLLNHGARMASAGEFTLRAFMNGKMDLTQAEAVADLIASGTKAAHNVAMKQMRGGFSHELKDLRDKLVEFAALIELELDFSEEDVEFADRKKMLELLHLMAAKIKGIKNSFKMGNVIKNGMPVAIVGKPNVGKSTLLNALLNEDRAIVSEIPGTTRDALEDIVVFDGVSFRFIDTAGLHNTDNIIENLGIDITYKKIEQADIVLYVVDINNITIENIAEELEDFKNHISNPEKKFIVVANKIDELLETPAHFRDFVDLETVFISAKRKENIEELRKIILDSAKIDINSQQTVLTNMRHYEAIENTSIGIEQIIESFENNVPVDLITIEIKSVLNNIGSITGEITNNEILENIFGRFCIGK